MHESTIFADIIWKSRINPDPHKLHVLTEMPPSANKKRTAVILDIMNYIG